MKRRFIDSVIGDTFAGGGEAQGIKLYASSIQAKCCTFSMMTTRLNLKNMRENVTSILGGCHKKALVIVSANTVAPSYVAAQEYQQKPPRRAGLPWSLLTETSGKKHG